VTAVDERAADGRPWPGAVPLLEIRHAGKTFGSRSGDVVALDDFSLVLEQTPPRVVALAGESGSGKTTAANLVLGFLTPTSGEVLYRGSSVGQLKGKDSAKFRQEVQAITQDPYSAFNPFYRVGRVFDTVLRNFPIATSDDDAMAKVAEALAFVGLTPDRVLEAYPHQLSGGERQRVMVARAFLLRPRLIIADEPVSMVDASIRATILELMLRLRTELGVSFLYITHDLSTAHRIADELIILRRGRVVEQGVPSEVMAQPKHAYTRLLMRSIPIPDPDDRWQGRISELQAALEAEEAAEEAARVAAGLAPGRPG
jgi:peptide/nickel transport system ATP-binding protein